MANVEIRNVKKFYGRKEIVRGISLAIRDGEFMVLVGPSGCGKSTILRMVAGLEEISEGEILIDGRVANALTPRERDVAMVFQSYALYPHMNVRENMGFGLKVRGVKKEEIDRLVAGTAAMLEIDSLLDSYPRQLSGGQRQRVAMGRAIVRHPKLFLFDEPLSNLDAALRSQMRVELKRLHQKLRVTVIYVTHDHVEAMTLADRIAVVHQGVIQQTGTPAEVFDSPRNKFVAGFIGSPPMNFLEGIFSASEPGRIEGERFVIPLAGPMEKRLARWKGDRLEVGIRPQHLALWTGPEAEPPTGAGTLRGTLEVMEPMGWETYLHVRLKSSVVVAHVESRLAGSLAPGCEIVLTAPPEKVHVFSLQGLSLAGGEPGEGLSDKDDHVPKE
jgi:multiple sugar transport system ATP-binding protein